jgi:hypothetical protein
MEVDRGETMEVMKGEGNETGRGGKFQDSKSDDAENHGVPNEELPILKTAGTKGGILKLSNHKRAHIRILSDPNFA